MPGYFDDIFEGGSPSAARAYDAYVGGTDGPARGARPMNDADYDISRMTDPLARFFGHQPMPQRMQSAAPGDKNGMGMQQNENLLDIIWRRLFGGRQPASTQGGTAFGGPSSMPSDAGRFPPQATGAPTPLSKPATKISSANDLAAKISAMIGRPQEPRAMGFPDWSRDFRHSDDAFLAGLPMPPEASPVNVPIRLGDEKPSPRSGFNRDAVYGIPSGIFARGGPINMMRGGYPELYTQPIRQGHFSTGGGENYVTPDGEGDGRSDHVEARLSPGEYVMDAESVSMLGNGDNDAGARKLDGMRKSIRKQKGKALAKGKFSPNAKDPMEYLVHDGISDGLRRRGKERG
jgi:hypothetical protein